MADTTTSTRLRVQQWDDSFFTEYVRESRFKPYMGTDENSIIQVKEDRRADQAAAAQRRKDDIRINQEASALERIAEIETTDMARRLARHRCIRMQQQARRDGGIAPAC